MIEKIIMGKGVYYVKKQNDKNNLSVTGIIASGFE